MGVTSAEGGLTMEGMEEEGKKSVNWKWFNFFGPYGTPLLHTFANLDIFN